MCILNLFLSVYCCSIFTVNCIHNKKNVRKVKLVHITSSPCVLHQSCQHEKDIISCNTIAFLKSFGDQC